MPPLFTVLTMTQIVSTLPRLLQGMGLGHPGHTPTSQSALHPYPLLTDDMHPLDLLQQELVLLLAPDTEAFLTLFGLLVQHYKQEATSTKLVSSKI